MKLQSLLILGFFIPFTSYGSDINVTNVNDLSGDWVCELKIESNSKFAINGITQYTFYPASKSTQYEEKTIIQSIEKPDSVTIFIVKGKQDISLNNNALTLFSGPPTEVKKVRDTLGFLTKERINEMNKGFGENKYRIANKRKNSFEFIHTKSGNVDYCKRVGSKE